MRGVEKGSLRIAQPNVALLGTGGKYSVQPTEPKEMMMHREHRTPIPGSILAAACILLLAATGASKAARPPVGKTYYTVMVGLASPYDVSTSCFQFGPNDVCSTDGDSCGSWIRTDAQGKQAGFTFDMSLLENGDLIRLQGEGRAETLGRKSAIGGTGRITGAGPRFNYSFAGREMPKARCQQMLDESPPGGDDGNGTLIVGSGNIASEPRPVSDFSRVALSGVGRLEIRHTGTESLTVRADDNLLQYMRSEVRNGVLILGNDSGVNFRTDNQIVYILTVRELDALTVAGVTFADVRGVDTDLFKVSVNGVAVVRASGKADRQRVSVTGVGIYDAADLDSRIVDVNISGVSGATMRASEQLNGRVKGVSSLEYIGNPAVNVAVDPGSSLRRLR